MAQNLEGEIKKMISKITRVSIEQITPSADFFEELGVDSMRAIEIVAAFEKKYKILIPEEDIPKMRTLASIVEFAKKNLK